MLTNLVLGMLIIIPQMKEKYFTTKPMGNLRDSMTEEEWNDMGLAMGLVPDNSTGKPLWETIPVTGDPNPLATLEWDKTTITNKESVEHPKHYGGEGNIYEAIKIIEAYEMDFTEGNVLKYLLRYKDKNGIEDLWKAHWYLTRLIKQQEEKI